MKGIGLLGIHETTNKLYWDGKEIVTRSTVRLGSVELWLASLAAVGTFGTFAIELARALGFLR